MDYSESQLWESLTFRIFTKECPRTNTCGEEGKKARVYRRDSCLIDEHMELWSSKGSSGMVRSWYFHICFSYWMVSKNRCFQTVILEKTLESPLDSKEMKPIILKEINPEYSLKGLMLKLQYFGHLMQRANSLGKTLILGKIEGRRRRGWQKMRRLDGITDMMPSVDMNQGKL